MASREFAEQHSSPGHHVDDRLWASQERFRLVFDNLPSPCAVYDADARFRLVNRSAANFMRMPAEQLIGRRDAEVLPEQYTAVYLPYLYRSIETGAPQRAECSFTGPLGTFHFIAHYVPLLDDQGTVCEVLGITYDITTQKRIEEELRRRDLELRALADNLPDIVARFDRQGRHLYVNRQVQAITGLPLEDFLGRTNADLNMPPELVALWDQVRARVFATREAVECEFSYHAPDGVRHFESRMIPELGADGNVEIVLAVTRDITLGKVVQGRLSESEERFRRAFEEAPIGMALISQDSRLLEVNRALCRMLGYSEAELVDRTILDITHPDDITETQQRLGELVRGGQPVQTVEKRYLAKSGRVVWVRVTSAAVRDGNQKPLYGLAMIENITDRRAVEQELERYREHLEELVASRTRALEASQETQRSAERLASLGTLSAGIAHEINNPVGTILLAAEMAIAACADGDTPTVTRCLEGIKHDAHRCGRIVKNVLSFARQQPMDKSPANLNEVVRHAIERMRREGTPNVSAIEADLSSERGLVLMNPVAIEQAITNLLHNALQSQTQPLTVRVTTTVGDTHCTITIADNGPGIPADLQTHIFDPFFTTRRSSGGMGLGLSLVHGTVSEHLGSIRVDSQPGNGTIFVIELPRYQPPAAAGPS